MSTETPEPVTAPDRAGRLEAAAAERQLDAILVTDLVNLRYVTGFTGSNGLALVGPGIRRFVTDFRYLLQSAEQLDPQWEREIATDVLARAAEGLPAEEPFRLGFDDAGVSVREHARLGGMVGEQVELVAAGGAVEELRARKDAGELDKLRAAAALADRALEEVLGRGLAGRTERDVALDLDVTMRRMGAEAVSFDPIVAAGAHGALPHAVPRDEVIPEGTLVVVDWGCVLDGYASDCTRTFATGEIDPRDAEVYATVLRAQEAALDAVRPGPTGKEVDAVARAIIDAAGHAEHFGHGLGHGVGMAVHEGPRLSKQGETALEGGHVVTVEPGIYVPGGVGVRIEDLVAVTADGHEVLSSLPKELRVVGARVTADAGRAFAVGPGEGPTVEGPAGGPLTFKARGDQTGGVLTAVENVVAPGEGPPLHVHAREDEAWWVIEGTLRFRLGEERAEAPAGTFVFVPRTVPHAFQNVGEGPARILVLFTPAGMERFFDAFAASGGGPAAFAAAGRGAGMEVLGPPLAVSDPRPPGAGA